MKDLKKVGTMLLLILFVVVLLPNNVQAKSKVKLNKTSISIQKGNTYTLKLQNNTKTIKWTSSNKKIATINSSGIVTAKKVGTCKVYAKVGKKKYACKVTVKVESSIFLDYKEIIMSTGDDFWQFLINKNTMITSGVKWTSSNKKIATISSKGLISAKQSGETTITAKYKNKKYSFKLYVIDDKIIYEDEYVKVSLYYFYGLSDNKYATHPNYKSIVFKIQNKTDKAFTFVTECLGADGREIYNSYTSTKISANTTSLYHNIDLYNNIKIESIDTISGSMYVYDNNYDTISTIDFSNIKIR